MALTAAVGTGVVAAVIVPWLVDRSDTPILGDVLNGRLVRIPVGGGYELHWSWLVFCVVTLFTWAMLAVTRDR